MGEDTKKPDPQSTTTPSSQEQPKKKEETIQDSPTAPAIETAAQKKDDEATPTTPPQQAATTPRSPPDPPNNSPPAAPPPDPPQPPNDDTKQGEDKGKSWADVIKDSVTILGGSTVVIVALFVFLGRRFAEGYFSTLNIPRSSVTFSTWSYGELGLVYLISFIANWNVIVIIIVVISLFISEIIFREIKYVSPQKSIKTPSRTVFLIQSVSQRINPVVNKILYTGFVVVILMSVFLMISLRTYAEGRNSAYQYIQESAVGVRLKSKEPFLISAPTVTAATATANDETTYTYEGLYLLTDNDGTYFLFDDVDETCSPTNVYIVQEAQLLSVEFISETFSKSCTPLTDTSPTPTVTPTTVPTMTPIPQATPTPMP